LGRYWELAFEPDESKTLEDWAENLTNAMDASLHDICDEDEQPDSFLSGGVDSSYILAKSRARTGYCVAYENQKASEEKEARATAAYLQRNFEGIEVSPEAFFANVDDFLRAYEQPSADVAGLSLFTACKQLAGKSTLLNIIGGIDTADSGSVTIGDHTIERMDEKELSKYRRDHLGFVFQSYNLIPNLTSLENVELMKDIVDVDINGLNVLDSVGLKDHAGQFPAQLSGGEQQRVSIARAVAKQPTMLLCDEPTGALDSKTGVLILNLLQDMSNNKGTTVVIVTHNAILAEAADKVIRIKNGQIESIVVNENPKKVSDLEW
jgi:putative ABC transport system ATP-binding protein